MAKKGFLSALFGVGGKRSSGSRASKGRSTSSKPKRTSLASKAKTRARRKSDVGKIYWTNDGYFTQHENPKKTKPRPVAVVDQRKSDGALAVTKLHKKDGKSGKDCIDGLVIKASEHTSLKGDSIVERRVIIGTRKSGAKSEAEKNHRPIFKGDLIPTNDKLSKAELKSVLDGVQNDSPEHRATYERTMRKWHDGFKKDK